MEKKSVKDCSIIELKAMAYDRVMMIENAQRELQIINQELNNRTHDIQEIKTGDS